MRIISNTGRSDLDTLFGVGAIGQLSDAELLARFVDGRGDAHSQAAFAAIVDRHGSMVLGLCRRVTGDPHAADDAFQATFLVLARKAGSVRVDGSLGRWLHGVGLRIARRARNARTTAAPLDGHDPIDPRPVVPACDREDLARVVDEEIDRLPPRYRSAVVLCLIEGMSQEQAARRLRCPLGTVRSRLHRARERLQAGLVRRGVGPSAGGFSSVLAKTAVPVSLASSTTLSIAGDSTTGAASATVAALANSFSRSLSMRLIWTTTTLASLALLGFGAAAVLGHPKRDSQPPVAAESPSPSIPDDALADRILQIEDEYDVSVLEYRRDVAQGRAWTRTRDNDPDFTSAVRKIRELTATAPKGPIVRDAWIWAVLSGVKWTPMSRPLGPDFTLWSGSSPFSVG